MLYDPTDGKRVKRPFNHISWVHQVVKLPDFALSQCLFGEHQLQRAPMSQVVGVVESEKTAIIASACWPELVWLATGSLTGLNTTKCQALQGRKVILFPDGSAYEQWAARAEKLQEELGALVKVSDWLEQHATQAQVEAGLDLADLIRKPYPD